MILETFKSYLPCKLWLNKHSKEREEFIFVLDGTTIPGISYEEQVGGSSRTEGQKKAIISDEIAAYDKKHLRKVRHCNNVIALCKEWLEEVELKNRKIFELAFMTEKTTHQKVADAVDYDRSWVRRRINLEIERLECLDE